MQIGEHKRLLSRTLKNISNPKHVNTSVSFISIYNCWYISTIIISQNCNISASLILWRSSEQDKDILHWRKEEPPVKVLVRREVISQSSRLAGVSGPLNSTRQQLHLPTLTLLKAEINQMLPRRTLSPLSSTNCANDLFKAVCSRSCREKALMMYGGLGWCGP